MSGRGIRQDCPSCGRLYCAHQEASALAAARCEGWAQAIEALREQARAERREAATYPSGSPGRIQCLGYAVGVERAIRALTDRAAALTEEGGQ